MNIATRRLMFASFAILGLASSVQAAEREAERYVVNVWEENHHGQLILAGNAESAVNQIATLQRGLRVNDNLHLCAAYLQLGKADLATRSCEAASAKARLKSKTHSLGAHTGRLTYAMAANNAGVMHALMGDEEAARNEFQLALRAKPWHPSAKKNLALLESRMSQQ